MSELAQTEKLLSASKSKDVIACLLAIQHTLLAKECAQGLLVYLAQHLRGTPRPELSIMGSPAEWFRELEEEDEQMQLYLGLAEPDSQLTELRHYLAQQIAFAERAVRKLKHSAGEWVRYQAWSRGPASKSPNSPTGHAQRLLFASSRAEVAAILVELLYLLAVIERVAHRRDDSTGQQSADRFRELPPADWVARSLGGIERPDDNEQELRSCLARLASDLKERGFVPYAPYDPAALKVSHPP